MEKPITDIAFRELAQKCYDETATAAERKTFEQAYSLLLKRHGKWDVELMGEEETVKAEILSDLLRNVKHHQSSKMRINWYKYMSAAAAVAAIVFGIWFFNHSANTPGHAEFSSASQYTNDIKPGKNTAIITFANGEVINLSDSKRGVVIGQDKLMYNDGSAVANLSPFGREGVARGGSNNNNPLSPRGGSLLGGERSRVQTLTASTPKGGTYQITLPDGTRVWLNADSKISFPSQFSGKQRKILLSGEAYFEVFKNKRMPFIVESNGQQVEVLGTHFNISAYKDEVATKTTLLEGSVRVAFLSPSGRDGVAREGSKPNIVTLLPNQQSTVTSNSGIAVREVNAEDAIDWKTGVFVYNGTPLQDVMRQIARWYDVDVVYKSQDVRSRILGGSALRSSNLSVILKTLESTGAVKFRIEGRRVYVGK